MHFIIRVFITH